LVVPKEEEGQDLGRWPPSLAALNLKFVVEIARHDSVQERVEVIVVFILILLRGIDSSIFLCLFVHPREVVVYHEISSDGDGNVSTNRCNGRPFAVSSTRPPPAPSLLSPFRDQQQAGFAAEHHCLVSAMCRLPTHHDNLTSS
jgi:hypothetical protein